ncbi:pilus assembly protein [Sinorhizobium numidicum]|uniref:Pilus assembly protein n=1 Tax=Sinorhizobium numidicum TaxID=680248 RepID=A0ABY8CR50_9HYPH|nr:pilus assembly protein [Sinorhizobium numidicum]WEX75129.1 pilus assembly protein [Sinorhizobium numidicum]WEX81123.1 pilus assembly protein [Sinorhizobium numidicum]
MTFQRSKRAFVILVGASVLSGCADYMNHRDSITFGLGNAVEANKGIHIRDAFPRAAQNTHIASDGKVIDRAIRSYQGSGQSGAPPPPTALLLPTATPPNGTNAAAPQ